MKTYLYQHSIPFQDTDMAGVVHFTQILAYVELAEHALLLELGLEPISSDGGLPKVHVECDYTYPLRFKDQITVKLHLVTISTGSLHWKFSIIIDGDSVKEVAKGKVTTAYVNSCGKPADLPGSWLNLLSE